MSNNAVNAARALLGQGVGLGWGDEGEAWLRSKLGGEDYQQALAQIQDSYGQFAQEHPIAQAGLEFTGAVAPGVAAMFVPGLQPSGAATIGGSLARLAAAGAASGGLSAAGYAPEGEKLPAAVMGAGIGGVTGAVLPGAMKGTGQLYRAAKERLTSDPAALDRFAAERLLNMTQKAGLDPAQIPLRMAEDASMGVPSVLANVDPSLARLAKVVSQRSGEGSQTVEKTILAQQQGARERAVQQVRKHMQPGDYYNDLDTLRAEMRARAKDAYGKAYADGVVTDPKVLAFLKRPQFRLGVKKAEELLAAGGRKLNMSKPTVEVLDNIKQGVDALIEKETDPVTGKVTKLGREYIDSKNAFLRELDRVSPDYWAARRVYAGDAEMADAMRSGLNDFDKLHHEEVIKKIAGMSDGEKRAFRTGVARNLYDKALNSSTNINAAKRLINAPEMQAKLQPLFDNPAQYKLFEAALKRESELTQQANKILGGSETFQNAQINKELQGGAGGVADIIHGGYTNSLPRMVLEAIGNAPMSEKSAGRLAQMLMSKDPHEVASVVALLEKTAKARQPAAMRAGKVQSGLTSGLLGMAPPAPLPAEEEPR